MKKIILTLFWLTFLLIVQAQHATPNAPKKTMAQLIQENFSFAEKQYAYLIKNTPLDSMPRTYQNGRSINSNLNWWCSGFFTGSLCYIYEYGKSPAILAEAKKRLVALEPEKNDTSNHDLGFKMFCSFGNAYRLLHDEHYKTVIFAASKSLSTRYRPSIQSIQSWSSSNIYHCPVIIDNMMNLEMLVWTSRNGGSKNFEDIAIHHANTTLNNHFRKNYSSYHVVDYDVITGKVIKKITAQGANDSSAWSRGQGWALYGYTMMYRFTKNPIYLKQAMGIASFLMHHPRLPIDKVPYWDFDAPTIPNAYRDASAAAICASAFLELSQYTSPKKSKIYLQIAKDMLQTLSSDKYRAKLGENGGFILMHSIGSIPHKSEIDVPLAYADYYFLEALHRYKNILDHKPVID